MELAYLSGYYAGDGKIADGLQRAVAAARPMILRQAAQTMRSAEEVRAEIERLNIAARDVEGLSGYGAIYGRLAALRWVLNEQETER